MFMTSTGREHKDRLEPFGNIAAMLDTRITEYVTALTDAELHALKESCAWMSQTNCWCMSYEAAQWMLPYIDQEILCRSVRRAQAAASA